MPPLDPSYSMLFLFLGGVIASVLTFLGILSTSKANTRQTEIESTADLLKGYRELKDEIKKEANDREVRQTREAMAREAALGVRIDELSGQFNEVLLHFGVYVEWAKSGAKPPPPFIPDWIYSRVVELMNTGRSSPE